MAHHKVFSLPSRQAVHYTSSVPHDRPCTKSELSYPYYQKRASPHVQDTKRHLFPKHLHDQQYSQGTESDGSAGDIVCWEGHVGICDGAGNVIHSYNANHNIRKDSIANVSKWDGRKVKCYVTF